MPEYCRMEPSADPTRHFRGLEWMYNASAAINHLTQHRVTVSESRAAVTWEVNPQFFHAAGSLHGSMYFKMLDDAAFFAANSIDREFFVLTATMNIQLFRPVTGGSLLATGWVTVPGRTLIHAHSEIRDERDKLIAAGQGTFTRSTVPLMGLEGYQKGYERC